MKTIAIFCKIVTTTDRAVLIHDGSEDKEGNPIGQWIPLSQIDASENDPADNIGKSIELEISEWLAKERGLI